MVTEDEGARLGKALEGKRLERAPTAFHAALIGLFDLEDADSFALVDGDSGVVLGLRREGLLIIHPDQDKEHGWEVARVRFAPFDEVAFEAQYRVQVVGTRHPLPTIVTVTVGEETYELTSDAGRGTQMSWVRALIGAKAGAPQV